MEQQVGANERLTRLVAQGEAQEIGELGAWIGQTVDAHEALYPLDADGLTVTVPEQSAATSVEAVIRDQNGATVARVPIDDPSEPFQWSGNRSEGQRAANGLYEVSFNYEFENSSPTQIPADASGRVIEARIDRDGPILVLDTGARIRPADIDALRLSEDADTA